MKDPRVEQWLDGYKLTWKYHEELKLERIAVDKQAKEQIRLTELLDDELVMRYGIALENKAQFPGIVVYPLKKTGDEVGLIAGWHRSEAYRLAGRKTIPAYLVTIADPLIITVLRRTSNTLEGKPPGPAEMLEHAVWIVRQGYSVNDAARLMSVPIKRLADRCLYDKVRADLATQGVAADELHISPTALARMSSLRPRDMREVALLGHEARLGTDMMLELTRQIRGAASDDDAADIIRQWRERYADDIRRSKSGLVQQPGTAIRRLPIMLKQAERMAVQTDGIASLTPTSLRDLIASCRRAIERLQVVVQKAEEALHGAANR